MQRGRICYKSIQILTLCTMKMIFILSLGQSQVAMNEAFVRLEKVAKKIQLHSHIEKTKYLPTKKKKKNCWNIPSQIEIENKLSQQNSVFTHLEHSRSHILSRKTKILFNRIVNRKR